MLRTAVFGGILGNIFYCPANFLSPLRILSKRYTTTNIRSVDNFTPTVFIVSKVSEPVNKSLTKIDNAHRIVANITPGKILNLTISP